MSVIIFYFRCGEKKYDLTSLPSASVIICFHEVEELDNLLHTIHSIVQNTPKQLLKEIILIDDNSHRGKGDKLWMYIVFIFVAS